ncbi:MAG: DUF1684 domain-containing protein [Chloroflexi bacterium]|nr:MAG: DUF1684 domain-containing protein [Chloroflexota bacterium]
MGILNRIKKVFAGQSQVEETTASPEKRELPLSFYIDTVESQRAEKDRFFQTSAYSPIEDRGNFTGLNYYPVDPALRLELTLEPAEVQEELTIQTSTGDEQTYIRLGTVSFEVEGQPARLAVYKSPHHDELFIPFRDATSGQETYGAGRYLEPVDLGNGKLLVDFNLAYNPYCAYSEHYSCPLPPLENWLKVPIRAGEKSYPAGPH